MGLPMKKVGGKYLYEVAPGRWVSRQRVWQLKQTKCRCGKLPAVGRKSCKGCLDSSKARAKRQHLIRDRAKQRARHG